MAAPYRADFDANEEYSGLRRPNLPVGNMTTQLPVYSGGFDVTAYQQQQLAQAQAIQQQQQLQQQLQAQQQQQAQQIASSLRADAAPFVMPIKDHTLSSNGWHNDLQQQQQQYNNSYQQVQLQPHLNGYMQQPQQQQPQQQNFTPPIANLYQRQRGMHQQMNALSSNLENRLNIGQQQQQSTRNTPGGTYFQDNAHTNYSPNFNNSNMSNRYHHQTYYNQQQQQNQSQQQQHQQHQQPHHHQHQHQNRDKYHYNAGTSKNTKYNNASAAASASSAASVADPANGDGNTEEESAALSYLQQVVQCLNENPGKFYSIATRFLTIFEGMEENSKVLSIAMEEIFQMSIQTPNFRYMGAKLYNLLYALNPKSDSLFNRLLKFKLDYHQKEVCEYMEKNQDNLVRETALFLAELYMQLRGDGRLTLIGENIVFSLKQLLKRETMDNLRCICLTLKLAGFDLSADCAQEMKDIIASLEAINAASPGKYAIVENVLSLQKNNWGRKTSISEVLPPMPVRMSDEPVFYGPDGTELTAEEAEFIKGVLPDDDDDDNDDDLDFDPEMDEETEKDYKEFLKLNASKS